MMLVYRLCKQKYADQLNGKGAAQYNNRWNSKGTEVFYTAQSRALALAEVAVHLTFASLPRDFVMAEIEIPEEYTFRDLDISSLGSEWNAFPHSVETMRIGDDFIDAQDALVLKVPSAVVKGDFNFLLNPHHPEMKQVKIVNITSFLIDERLFKFNS